MLSNFLSGIIVILFFFFMLWLDKRKQEFRRKVHYMKKVDQEEKLEVAVEKEQSQNIPPNGRSGGI